MNYNIDQSLDHRLYESSTYQSCHHLITLPYTQRGAIFQCFSLVILLMLLGIPLAWASTSDKTIQDAHSFDSRNPSFMRLSLEQGLPQSSGNAIVQDHQGYTWFGIQEGLNRYDGYKIEVFEHDHKDPASLTNDWTTPATFKRTTYTNLPAGTYSFKVMVSNNDGIWNEHGKAITLQVIPPPRKTGWAYGLYTLIAICLVVTYQIAQTKKLRLEEQVQQRTQEISKHNEQLQDLNKQLKDASITDPLTGLKNRRYMDEFIEAEVAQENRLSKGINESGEKTTIQDIASTLSFMMLDLDGFKAINDTYGHHAGDQALIQVSDILQQCCRQSDTIIRWGGDEFLIVSRNTSANTVETLADRIRTRLAAHLYQLGDGNIVRLSSSIGFALYPFSLQDPNLIPWEQVVNIADRGAYVVKENGRNAWVGLYGTQSTTVVELTRIKHELGDLVEKDILQLNTSITGDLNLAYQKAIPRSAA